VPAYGQGAFADVAYTNAGLGLTLDLDHLGLTVAGHGYFAGRTGADLATPSALPVTPAHAVAFAGRLRVNGARQPAVAAPAYVARISLEGIHDDRDFFQLVRDRDDGHGAITVLFNRRGISEIDPMDREAVIARYGITPEQYLDFVALKGDTSDNIPGVPGVGDKTAAKLVNEFGSVEELLAHTDRLKGKQKENIEAAGERLVLNKQLARIVTDLELEFLPEDCVMGASDPEQVRSLFVSLEFRSLLDRLAEALGTAKPVAEIAELDLRRVDEAELLAALAEAGREWTADDGSLAVPARTWVAAATG